MRARFLFALIGLALLVLSVIPAPNPLENQLPTVIVHSGLLLLHLVGLILVLPFAWKAPALPFQSKIPVWILAAIGGGYLIFLGYVLVNSSISPDPDFLPATVITLGSLLAALVMLLVMVLRFRDRLPKWVGFILLLCTAGASIEMFSGWVITAIAISVTLIQWAHYWFTQRVQTPPAVR